MEIPNLMFSEPDDDDESEAAMTDFEDMSDIEEQTISRRKQKQKQNGRRSNSVTGALRTPEQTEYNRFLKPLPKVPQHVTDDFFPAPLKIQPPQQQPRDIAIAGLSRDLSSMFRQDLSTRTIPPISANNTSTPPSQPAIIPLPTHRPKISLYPSINTTPPPAILLQQQQPLRARSASPPRSPALIHRDQLHGASFSPTKSPRTVVQHWLQGIKRGDGNVVGRERERSRSRSPKMGMHGMWGRKGSRREEVWI